MSPRPHDNSVRVSPKAAAGFAGQPPQPTVVWLTGEHDLSNVAEVSRVMVETIALDRENVVVDLGGVSFLSGATAAIFLRANAFLNARSRALVLRAPRRNVIRLLGLCGLAHLISPPPPPELLKEVTSQSLRSWVEVPTEVREAKSDPSARATPPCTVRADVSTAAELVMALNDEGTLGAGE